MNTTGKISLLHQDILALKGLKNCIDKRSLSRLKTLTEEWGPVPLHVPSPNAPRKAVVVLTENQGDPLFSRRIPLDAPVSEETLRLTSAGCIGPDLSLMVRKEHRIDMESPAFAEVARAGAFELEVMAFAFNPLGKRIYISEKGPLGSAAITPERFPGGASWELWQSMARELAGVEGTAAYVCSMVDIKERPGRITLAGRIESYEIPMKGEAVPWTANDISALVSKSGLDRRLRTALLVCGHAEWGPDFLKKADK